MKVNRFHAYVLAGLITLFAPLGQTAVANTAMPAVAPAAQVQASKPDAAKTESVDMAKVSEVLRKQAGEKDGLQGRLRGTQSAGAARLREPVDRNQVSVRELDPDANKLDKGTPGGIAYVQRYTEPNDYAHRNYCGAGAATVAISHWSLEFPGQVDIDQLGQDMDLDPNGGVWVKDITQAVNDRVNQLAGQDLNWYRYGEADNIDEFRFMLDYDIRQNGVPLVTSLQTGDLPGWGGQDVGHIVAVYGFYQGADGKEYVAYADTAPDAAGYEGPVFQAVELGTFWQAVSANSAQVW